MVTISAGVYNARVGWSVSGSLLPICDDSIDISYYDDISNETVTTEGILIDIENDSLVIIYGGDEVYCDGWQAESASSINVLSDASVDEDFANVFNTIYVAESSGDSSGDSSGNSTSAVEITYKGETISLFAGETATLHIKDHKLTEDLVVKANAVTSPLPNEVATEAEMNALLTTAEVGSVYKYIGTTGTYENGALYVVEESE